ncbi:heterotrimeric G-protein alpha subunit, GPA3-like protein [Mycena maculata]|uniref:Heterotrimeric G-protein alpha subunit, GPA3-like protein n=1 Tax=Mycena maculata TaxID=230809 RepID=A0AAD7MUR1_9AGAR|nr:heterotrimeric G-protein alpha subunit, GPA3-like protein [Mycena maculata]
MLQIQIYFSGDEEDDPWQLALKERLTVKEARTEKARSDAIDRHIREDRKRFQKEHKILVLGTSESGKSTIVKQMKIVHQGGHDKRERGEYRMAIYKNVLDCVGTLARVVRKVGVGSLPEKVWEHAEVLLRAFPAPSGDDVLVQTHNAVLTPALVDAVWHIWRAPAVVRIVDEHLPEFYLVDSTSAGYFFSSIHRIADPAYVPNEEDILHARTEANTIMETRFFMGDLLIHLLDISGQRSERKKWIHHFDSVTSIIFCASLGDYDRVLEEEGRVNRMHESLYLFESIINSQWFLHTSVILFLTKIEVFKKKLPRIPLGRYFPEYTGGNDLNKAVKYILWKFIQENRARLAVYPHVTQATNTKHISLVYAAVKETIQQNSQKNNGLLYATVKEKIQRNTLKYSEIL